ncbi:PhoX family protein [Hydrogenophaga palleronii]|uniref:PhoX family protein n=1 Tax=Hydrogenophaga palleronii TaxID=65655 RepID=UPI0008244138|nr:alkaline phosphatase PhoX [Hydrogenophaga palleronii]
MSHQNPEENLNESPNEHFDDVLQRAAMSRRNLIRGGVGLAAMSTIPFMAACGGGGGSSAAPAPAPAPEKALGFSAIDKSLLDDVILPAGYTYSVVHATGDRLVSGIQPYSNTGAEADEWNMRVGDHHDGMDLYYIHPSGKYSPTDTGRAVLVMNHESSADAHFFHPHGQTTNGVNGKKFSQFSGNGGWDLGIRLESEVLKEINHHGVSVVELGKGSNGRWEYRLDSLYNRRVNGQTVMRIAGPDAHLADIRSFMVTAYDTTGASSRGTLNNCGHGKTPWGTYLACEENWATYFFMPSTAAALDTKTRTSRSRYGVISAGFTGTGVGSQGAPGQGWSAVASAGTDNRFGRWNVSAAGATAAADFRNEPNTFGFNVEIDPLTNGTPAKRVAMGRFAHEAAVCGLPVVGQPLAFYMGCDSRNEYIYKFVSTAVWSEADIGGGIAAGDKYLNEGKLYVAKFNDTGAGEWLELSFSNPLIRGYTPYVFANQADVLINARHAADAVGATKMDRPEWGAVNPANGDIYFTMTNNSAANRTPSTTNAANPRAYTDLDGRRQSGNPNGHIVRFKETGTTSTATSFTWDIFLFGAESTADAAINLSGLSAKNDFSSPDGLWFSKATGICWIQTDDGAYTDMTNCMLLAAIPGAVGDGRAITVNNTQGSATGSQNTFIGAALGDAKLRRFMVAPKGSEVTGITETADGRAIFVNIQHPGENTAAIGTNADFTYESQWPGNKGYGPTGRPRSATIVITRTDGGVIGL